MGGRAVHTHKNNREERANQSGPSLGSTCPWGRADFVVVLQD